MATPVPIEMPQPLPVNSKLFDLNYNQDISPVGAGFIQTIERASPVWMARYATPPLSDERDQAFQAFLDQLDGSMNVFLAYDPRRPRPYAYRNSGESRPWIAAGQTDSRVVNANWALSQLVLDRLVTGAILTRGDYIAYKRGNAWYLHRVATSTVADGSGVATVTVTPRPLTNATDVTARLLRAPAAMKVMGSVEKEDQVSSLPSYSFSAVQFIDRST